MVACLYWQPYKTVGRSQSKLAGKTIHISEPCPSGIEWHFLNEYGKNDEGSFEKATLVLYMHNTYVNIDKESKQTNNLIYFFNLFIYL